MLKRLAVRSINRSETLFRLAERAAFLRFKAGIDKGAACGSLQLHLGCGSRVLDGWVNVDMRFGRDILTAKLPRALARFPSNSARFIYASHVLEHLDYPIDANLFAKECHRLLVKGGRCESSCRELNGSSKLMSQTTRVSSPSRLPCILLSAPQSSNTSCTHCSNMANTNTATTSKRCRSSYVPPGSTNRSERLQCERIRRAPHRLSPPHRRQRQLSLAVRRRHQVDAVQPGSHCRRRPELHY